MKKVLEAYIVPWVLPNEEIPLRVTWPKVEEFDSIQIKIPDDLKIVDVLNIDEFRIEDKVVTIKPKRPITNTPNYFGMILSAPKIYKELNVAKKIVIEFLRQNEVVNRRELYARIFRPYLEVIEVPEKINELDLATSPSVAN